MFPFHAYSIKIKATHHLLNVSGDKPPVTIENSTKTLATIIKPSIPSDNTMDLIWGNAKNWSRTTLLILRDHLSEVIETETTKLSAFMNPDWE